MTYKPNGIERLGIIVLLALSLLPVAAAPCMRPSQARASDRKPSASGDRSKVEMRAVVDRIEGTTGVLYMGQEEDARLDLPVKYLPSGARPGAVLKITIAVDRAATQDLKGKIERLHKQLKHR